MILTRCNAQNDGFKHVANIALLEAANGQYSTLAGFARQTYENFDLVNDKYDVIGPSANNTAMVIVRDFINLRLLVVCCGMSNYAGQANTFQQAPALIAGWRNVNVYGSTEMQPFQSAASLVMAFAGSGLGATTWREITLVGHSFGGAVCTQLHMQLGDQFKLAGIKSFTYGSPKSYNTNQSRMRLSWYTRVLTPSDPVACLPPSPSESPVMMLAIPPFPSAISTRVSHPVEPYYVHPDGTMSLSRQLSGVIPRTNDTLQLVQWLTGVNVFGSPNHSLAAYKTALMNVPLIGEHPYTGDRDWGRAGLQPQPENTPDVAGEGGGGDADDLEPGVGPIAQPASRSRLPKVSAVAQRREIVENLREQGAITTASVVQARASWVATQKPVANAVFASRTIRGVRTVTYGGEFQWICSNRREQRKLVRDMNNVLREMGFL
jgi:hypothetical protein